MGKYNFNWKYSKKEIKSFYFNAIDKYDAVVWGERDENPVIILTIKKRINAELFIEW